MMKLAKKYHPDVNKDDPEAAKRFQVREFAFHIFRAHIVSTILGILSFMKDTRSKFITDYY